MMFKSDEIKSTVECGSCQRLCVGETCCKGVHTNEGSTDAFIGLTPDFPAKVVPINLGEHSGKMIVKGGAWMGNIGNVRVSMDCDCNCCTCCCGGMGLIRQSVIGNGTAFLAAGGTVLTRKLGAEESIIVDTNSLVGYEDGVTIKVKRAGGCCTMCCGGEGLFNTKVKGPGLIVVQSMSFENYKRALVPPVQKKPTLTSPGN